MRFRKRRVATYVTDSIATARPGVLFIVATPIGNLGDLGARARGLLRDADLLLAEDTRHTQQLLHAVGIARAASSIESLHEHNERERVAQVVERLKAGQSVALVSDAGTPLVSDPGAPLVQGAIAAGVEVVAVPGPCAAIAALTVAGLPADRHAFEGFLPARPAARRKALEPLAAETRTLVFYEAPHRLVETLVDLAATLGADRPAAVVREITKRYERAYRATLGELARLAADDADMRRGEIVIVVRGAAAAADPASVDADRLLRELLAELPASQAARIAAKVTGQPRKDLYDRALALAPARAKRE